MNTPRPIDIMIIGAQKAGTTSLKAYLSEHPDIVTHLQMEMAWFADDKDWERNYEDVYQEYYQGRDIAANQKLMAKSAAVYEAPRYMERMHQHNPNCQVVFLIREPVARAYSSYLMEQNSGWVDFPFSKVMDSIQKHTQGESDVIYRLLVNMGLYADALEVLYQLFPKDQVQVFLFEDLKKDPQAVCHAIFEKAGIDPNFQPETEKRYNTTNAIRSKGYAKFLHKLSRNENPLKRVAKKLLPAKAFHKLADTARGMNKTTKQQEPIDLEVARELAAFFLPHNQRLEQMIGKDLSAWHQKY